MAALRWLLLLALLGLALATRQRRFFFPVLNVEKKINIDPLAWWAPGRRYPPQTGAPSQPQPGTQPLSCWMFCTASGSGNAKGPNWSMNNQWNTPLTSGAVSTSVGGAVWRPCCLMPNRPHQKVPPRPPPVVPVVPMVPTTPPMPANHTMPTRPTTTPVTTTPVTTTPVTTTTDFPQTTTSVSTSSVTTEEAATTTATTVAQTTTEASTTETSTTTEGPDFLRGPEIPRPDVIRVEDLRTVPTGSKKSAMVLPNQPNPKYPADGLRLMTVLFPPSYINIVD